MNLSPDVIVTETDTGTVLLDERTGRYWTLNPTGGAVLRLLVDGRTPEEAAGELARRHPAFADRIAQDVRALVGSLLEEKVMVP
ncbi:Coenzyme PQQ synthesis protein D (PqqD) [Thermomonospora echinospora]|uniref:Coenzyme PQQ synthesis protein D (PqqD) n=1 Tax=Thermomonospora echinospora TaxID=1992 RepID=A0A1H6DKA2_9ACTN|nr:lasso peptide biosynthesis PqqD family chaperone [Thermomonospora echinospora]SEG85541.1 Coenzyme PQQ synthesis protein D (PqqD) [Thermomonospora echinospora]